ncbi:unnamed protein product [Rotaria socialis]|uniref:Globin-sensor domain-containing protein n=1 Tax=Rotaria socialis TaxID=392032 RepID=A0A817RYQ4_9BILA|nr:unnamed protein product [Rotaria socialis]CAF3416444.1 unnamed protein product [Rotaria socialis]CAF3457937.1 unnamed protein product [Rotaria socialis]CAF4466976.1 unnamed protein product [Rotaria socialis]CAF4522763.1 unnamed protein product [Rotaria socialis]
MENINAAQLDTDIQYRFAYLSKFLNFTQDDISVLNKIAPVVVPLVPTVVDAIYGNLFSFDITKSIFANNTVHFKGNTTTTPGSLDLTPERVTFLKDMLGTYLKKALSQSEWNKEFLDYLSHLGKIHANKAASGNVNISYIFMNATLGFAQHVLLNALLTSDLGLDEGTKIAAILAVNKFFWIQNDFFTMHYISN